MEVEAKFQVPDEETFQHLLGLGSLAGLRLTPVPPVDVTDRYFDTADGDLWAAGVACRVRTEGSRCLATVKGLGNAEGAIHHRVEYEVELDHVLPPALWPPGEARGMVERFSRDKPLQPLFDLEQQRHRRLARPASPPADRNVAEISLDRVRVRDGEATIDSYSEVEAELLPGGTLEDLDRLAGHLADAWGLKPEPCSKFERALRLFRIPWAGGEESSAAGSTCAPAPPGPDIKRDDLMSEAGRKALRQQLQKVIANEPGTRLGESAEALHDMRVATRRMRAAFRVFGDYYRRDDVAGYRQGLKDTGRALGPVRDLDVFIDKVHTYLDSLPPEAGGSLDTLLSALARNRQVARANMLAYLDGDEYARFKEELARFCDTPGMASRPVATDVVDIEPHRVRDLAPVAIYQRLAVVRAYDEQVRSGSASLKQLHALRIACKRLRYTLEFFQRVLGPDAQTVIQEIVHMQDHLGAVQDVVVARELIQALLQEHGPDPGIQRYLDYREAELAQLLEALPEAWSRLNSPGFDQMVARAVVGT